MGSCSSKGSIHAKNGIIEYRYNCTIYIKQQDPVKKNRIILDPVSFQLTKPLQVVSSRIHLGQSSYTLSSCILPGLDPRGQIRKQCQDLCFHCLNQSFLLLTVFDGHGPNGLPVVQFCKQQTIHYFNQRLQNFHQNPYRAITSMAQFVDSQLQHHSGIDVISSGCTGVFILINQTELICGSVGDSRAVMATESLPEIKPVMSVKYGQQRDILKEIATKRNKVLDSSLHAVQLTQDQKPEDKDQLERITQAGGRVQKLTDEDGNKIGPYRVWEMNRDVPGIAMSRSIGDTLASKLGVTSNTINSKYFLSKEDCFLVVASDGV